MSSSFAGCGRLLPALLSAAVLNISPPTLQAEPLPGTQPLEATGDLAAAMVDGIGKYLDRELTSSADRRKASWKRDFSSADAYAKSVRPNRERLRKILGAVDERVKFADIEYVGGPKTPALVADAGSYQVFTVRWPVLPGVNGEGLLLEPHSKPVGQVVALPDASKTPEQLVGLAEGIEPDKQFARRLAEAGFRVIVPVLIDRKDTFSGNARLGRWTNQPHREFVYRTAYEMGRHVLGYEVQKVLAAVDWFAQQSQPAIGVWGYGEGGLLALLAGALDERIQATVVDGYFGPRERLWEEPIYRNVWSYLREFGDAEVGSLVFPRALIVGTQTGPEVTGPPQPRQGRGGAAPGKMTLPTAEQVKGEFDRLTALVSGLGKSSDRLHNCFGKADPFKEPMDVFVPALTSGWHLSSWGEETKPTDNRKGFDPSARQQRQFDQLVAFTQKVWRDSDAVRDRRFAKADASSPEAWDKSVEPIRQFFWEEVIGKLSAPDRPMNPRTRQVYDEPKWTGHEVTLDLYPDVFAYGILLLPKGLKPGEKRPVVVCQHGLEGRPTDVTNPRERTRHYNSFGARLADRGYIVFAPQNPYIGQDRFRVLQRKANPLKLSLFSFIVRQHERILDWLATQPNVDPERMAFYGLSYGGKTAMRVPALLKKYCLSICSGDFNEWVGKNVSVDLRVSYMFTGEYEMPEWDLGQTFNYAEMAYLIAPRPFMVERGHDDGVGIDEMVASEYAKVRYLYANRLKVPDRTEIEFFAGGHEIHGQGTFAFLQRHLKWPPRP